MTSAKVGFVPCGVHVGVTDSLGRPFIDFQMLKKAVESLRGAGLDVFEFKTFVRRKEDAINAVESCEKEDVDCIIFYAATWLWASEIVGAARSTSRPIIVWTPPISQGWATGGAMVLHGTFDEVGIKHKLVYGFPHDSNTMAKIKAFAKAARVVGRLKKSTVGLIGGFSMGAFTGRVDEAHWMEKFGLNVEHVDQYLVVREAEQIPKEEVTGKYEELKELIDDVPPLDEIMDRSIRIYLAMKKIIEEKSLDFVALKCFPELGDYYGTACLAQSLLGDEGLISACIGDLNTALTAYIMHLLTGLPVFSPDVQQVQKEQAVIKLTSDGACPPGFAKDLKEVRLSRRGIFGEGAADGICVGLVCKPGTVTLARLCRIRGNYHLHISPGEAYKPPKEKLEEELNACGFPHWPHAFIKLRGSSEDFIQNQRSEYISMCYGDLKEELVNICYLLEIQPLITA